MLEDWPWQIRLPTPVSLSVHKNMSHNKGKLQFSLKEAFVKWTVWLGVILWLSSLFVPTGIKGDDNYRGIELLIGAIVLTCAGSTAAGNLYLLFSVIGVLLQILMLTALVFWFGDSRRVLLMRGVSILLVSGAFIFKLAEHELFDATDFGFKAWISSFLFVGLAIFTYSFMLRDE